MPPGIGYGKRRRLPADSPRVKSAQGRAIQAREGKMGAEESREDVLRRMKFGGRRVPFQR